MKGNKPLLSIALYFPLFYRFCTQVSPTSQQQKTRCAQSRRSDVTDGPVSTGSSTLTWRCPFNCNTAFVATGRKQSLDDSMRLGQRQPALHGSAQYTKLSTKATEGLSSSAKQRRQLALKWYDIKDCN
jgi:hypothetical protein